MNQRIGFVVLLNLVFILLPVRTSADGGGTGEELATPTPQRRDIVIEDSGFEPAYLLTYVYDSIRWINKSKSCSEIESVLSKDLNEFDSKALLVGDSYVHRFREPGVVKYRCKGGNKKTGTIELESPSGASSP